ncbi:MAG: HepT-like ribonuclease domain-containing protein [Bythopirellula sp.]|nr:HepT-like ribonuclease domain-containing protein [Bythopirellula sp.]
MSQHNEQITLRQMLDLASEAVSLCQGRSLDDFSRDRLWCLAMERLVLNVGEAAKRVSVAAQAQLPQIPWPQIIAFRNRIVHGYDSVDYSRVWQILQTDMPQLILELKKLNLPEFK